MSKKSARLLMALLAILTVSAFGGCGHKKKSNLLWLALMGNGGPGVSPSNAGDGSTPAVGGPAVQEPTPPAQTPAASPPTVADPDPDLNCAHSAANDPTPPSILKTLPADGQTDANTDSTVTVYFKNPIQCSSVQQIIRSSAPGAPIEGITNLGAVQLYEEQGMVAGRTDSIYYLFGDYYPEGNFILGETECKCNRVRMKPLTPLLPETNYWIILGKSILSENGVAFPGNYPVQSQGPARYFHAQNVDLRLAAGQGNLVHFSTLSDCPTISQVDDPAFDRTPLKLCSMSPRAVKNTSPWEPIVLSFNKPVDCAHFKGIESGAVFTDPEDSNKPGEFGLNVGFLAYTAKNESSQFGRTLRSSCNGREIRTDVTGEFLPTTTRWTAWTAVGNTPDAKHSGFFRKPIKLLKIGPPFNWTTDSLNPFIFNGGTSADREGTINSSPGSGGTTPPDQPPGSGGTTPPDQPPGGGGNTPPGGGNTPPTCTDDQVLVNNQCVPETDPTSPGSDQGDDSEDEGGGPEKACPGRKITVDVSKGKWYQSAVPSSETHKNAVKAGVHTYWANQPLYLRVRDNCQAGWYRLILTASNIDGPLPSFYKKFNVNVLKNDAGIGGINIKASDTEYNRGAMLVYLKKGDTDLNLLWTNDAYKQGEYDANINLAEIALRYTQRDRYDDNKGHGDHEHGREHDHHREREHTLRQASRYCDIDGRWFWDGDAAYTYWEDQSLKFCFPKLKAGRYQVQVEVKNHSDGLPLPAGYESFKLTLTSNHSEAALSIPASGDYKKASTIMDLTKGDSITVTWKNDMYIEGSADANIQIHKIKLIPLDSESSLAGFATGARFPALLSGLVGLLGLALLGVYRLRGGSFE